MWIVASGTGFVQKYSSDGSELLLQIGESGVYDSSDGTREGRPLNSNRAQFFLPASIDVDAETGDIYVADGETPGGNQRIAVLDRNGRFLRQWALRRTEAERDLTPAASLSSVSRRRPGVCLRPAGGSDPGVRPDGQLHPEYQRSLATLQPTRGPSQWHAWDGRRAGFLRRSGSAPHVRRESEQCRYRHPGPPDRAGPVESWWRPGTVSRAVHAAPRHRRRFGGQRLRCRTGRPTGSEVQESSTPRNFEGYEWT